MFWSIRYAAGWDFRLSRRARVFRWSIVIAGFAALHLKGSAFSAVRVAGFLVAITVLCWPNLAYRLDKMLFRDWPEADATVESAHKGPDSVWDVRYSFEFSGERRGGSSRFESRKDEFPIGSRIKIVYDPLNPTESKVISSTSQ